MLTAAREACGHYVWTVNQRAAKDAGLSDDIIAAIREYRAPAGFDADDATCGWTQWRYRPGAGWSACGAAE